MRTDSFELEMPQRLDIVPLERVRPKRRIRLSRPVQVLQPLPWSVIGVVAFFCGHFACSTSEER